MLRKMVIIGISVFFLLCSLGCGGLIGMYQDKNPELTTYTYEGEASKVEIGLPFELKDYPATKIPEDIKPYVVKYFDKRGSDKNMVEISLCSFDVEKIEHQTNEDFEVDLDEATNGCIGDIKNSPNIKDVKTGKIKPITISGIEGREFSIEYTYEMRKGHENYVEGNVVVFMKDSDLWSIMLANHKGDDISKDRSNKVRETIKIK